MGWDSRWQVYWWMILAKSTVHYLEAFINCNFSCTRFHTCKTILGTCLCTWEIVLVKEQTCMLLMITWYSSRKCTTLVLNLLTPTSSLSISVSCTAPVLQILLLQFTWWLPSILAHYTIYLYSSTTIFDKLKWEAVWQI